MSATTYAGPIAGETPDVPPPAYAASLDHCVNIRRKIETLNGRLADATSQLYFSVDREYREGRLAARKLRLNVKAGR